MGIKAEVDRTLRERDGFAKELQCGGMSVDPVAVQDMGIALGTEGDIASITKDDVENVSGVVCTANWTLAGASVSPR